MTSSVPVTSGLRSVVGSARRGPQPCRRRDAGARGRGAAPGGEGDAGAGRSTQAGSVTVTSYDADGTRLGSERVAVKRLTCAAFDLPAKTSLVDVRAEGTPLPGRSVWSPTAEWWPAATGTGAERTGARSVGRVGSVGTVAGVDVLGVDARAARRPVRRGRCGPSPPAPARVSHRCSIGRRNSTSRVGVRAAAADERGQRHVSGSSRRVSAACPRRRTPPGRAGPASASSMSRRCRAPARRTARRASGSSGRPGRPGRMAGPRMPRPRRSRVRRRGTRSPGVLHTASLIRRRGARGGTVGAVSPARRCSRTACGRPAVTTLTYVYADQTAVLGPARDVRRAARLRPLRRHSERLSAPRGWEVLRLAPDPAAAGPRPTTCWPSPTPSARPPGPLAEAPGRRAAGAGETGRETGRRGHLRMLTSD